LMSTKERMLKDKNVSSGRDITMPTRDGELFMLTRQRRFQPRDTMEISVSIWTDHSISDQECQWRELLNV
jgi:hypothetical protein